jgi:hypothetical protein
MGDRPPRSVWDGVYSFPGQPANLPVWLLLAVGLTIFALIISGLRGVYVLVTDLPPGTEITGGGGFVLRGAAQVTASLTVLSVLFSLHPAACFLRVIEETAAGTETIEWPREPWFDYLGRWFYLLWLVAISIAFSALVMLTVPLSGRLWWCPVLLLSWFIFPVFLLSTLSGGAWWMLVDGPMFVRLLQRPGAALFLVVNVVVMAIPWAVLGYFAIVELHMWLIPAIGVTWSTMLLIYGRALGRTGWAITFEEKRRVMKRRKKRRPVADDDNAEAEEDDEDAEK